MEDKLKILMTTDTVGGVWTYSLELGRALQPYGMEIHLTAMGGLPSAAQKQAAAALPNVILYESKYKLEWMENPWDDVKKAQDWLYNLYLNIQPDLIHLNNYAKIHENWNCPIITVFHSCVATWWRAVKKQDLPQHWQPYVQQLRETLQASDVVVAPSKAILQQAKEIHDISSETKVIYNARDIPFSSAAKKKHIIFCIGRIWDEAKNLQMLSKIAKNLPWPVYIAGSNIDPNSGETSPLENVHFLGDLSSEEIQIWMQRAAIFTSPTKYEPFGLAILEAAKAKCALVISDLPSLQELWAENALYFNPLDEKEAEENILQLIEDHHKRNILAEKAYGHSQIYKLELMGEKYEQLYRELILKRKKNELKISI